MKGLFCVIVEGAILFSGVSEKFAASYCEFRNAIHGEGFARFTRE